MRANLLSVVRQQAPLVFRRQASTATESATKGAQQTAANATSQASAQASAAAAKASETISNISAKAGPAVMSTLAAVGRVGGPVGRLVKGIESLIPPTLSYTRTALELSKIVIRARSMAPPSISTFETSFKNLIRNPPAMPSIETIRARMTNRESLINGGVIVGEVLGFFTVGEMIGRRKIVGYRGKVESAHH